MQTTIRTGLSQEFDKNEIYGMYRLRARVFCDRMGWDIPTIDGMEIDGYDALGPHYMLIQDPSRRVLGCWRTMPTDGPNMLRDTFGQLLQGSSAPAGPHIWELSRFAIESNNDQAFGFADLTTQAIRTAIAFADRMGISRYVTVTTTSMERMLRRTGMEVSRIGQPQRIGVENAVALDIAMSPQTHAAMFGPLLATA
ncbi:acyl-homoserine-lactone synthase [Paraburkholderia dinghuensis]|uniref:Acyl-homoserine-lactone synthase n=1 Tax=Paraburkholderia dinghuensis TaxID=2305225 RepID=A0A3N6MYP9_9BURK|nr:acyl-homoserine-lactone synthase [Paraburkholderia dinghuensis]RQH09124.1 GNAT family N-acetyltransferase [Paraburkholderia dinghuensis]